MQGKIVKGISGFYYVHVVESGLYECKAKGVFRKDKMKPLVGDNVEIDVIDEENKKADVYMQPDQVSLAIGKGGYNIRLAGKLTGYEIEVYRDTDIDYEDVDLDEFSDEIEEWIIEELKSIGCDTAKSVLELSAQELENRTDLEEETILHVLSILKAEFED